MDTYVYWRFLVDFAGTEARADAKVEAQADTKVEEQDEAQADAQADAKVEAQADTKVEEQDESRAMDRADKPMGLPRCLAHRRMRSSSWCLKMRSSSWPQNRPYRRSCGHTN